MNKTRSIAAATLAAIVTSAGVPASGAGATTLHHTRTLVFTNVAIRMHAASDTVFTAIGVDRNSRNKLTGYSATQGTSDGNGNERDVLTFVRPGGTISAYVNFHNDDSGRGKIYLGTGNFAHVKGTITADETSTRATFYVLTCKLPVPN